MEDFIFSFFGAVACTTLHLYIRSLLLCHFLRLFSDILCLSLSLSEPLKKRKKKMEESGGGTGTASNVARVIAVALDWSSPPDSRNAAISFLDSVTPFPSLSLCNF